MALRHLRSSTANKRPDPALLAEGQISINTNTTSPGLYFKDSTGATIIKVGPVHVGATAPNASPPVGGSTGNGPGEVWLDTSLTPPGVKIWNAATSAWVNATPIGSETVQGLLELATNAETQTGTDATRAVTPASLQSKLSDSISTTSATTIASSTAVKTAYDLANAALARSGGTITGNLEIGPTGSLSFEGSTDDGFETTFVVANPTADRSITIPDVTGTLVTTGDTGSVTSTMIANGTILDADINASAAIALSKLATGALPTGITVASTNIVDSPALAGTPTAPTAAAGTNTTQIATTAFVSTAVDAARQGLTVKQSCRAATTANITLSGLQTIDGVVLAANDRVLVKNQSTASQNGIYLAASGAWTRATDFDAASDLTDGAFTFIEEGTANADSGWVLTTDGAIVVGTTALAFAQFSGAGQLVAGDGLTKTGNTISVATGGITSAMIANNSIVNEDISASAAIAGTKVSPDFGSQNIATTGTNTSAALIPTGSSIPTNGLYLPSANTAGIAADSTGTFFVSSGSAYVNNNSTEGQTFRHLANGSVGTSGGGANYAYLSRATLLGSGDATIYGSWPFRDALASHTNVTNFDAVGITAGSGTTTNQYGFRAQGNIQHATNNFGFYGNISSSSGRWNFYANGTAPNYFAGDVRSNTSFTCRSAPVNSNVTATATAASLLDGLRTGTPTANINLQVPTGTNMDAAFQELQTNQSFEWSVINLAAATHVITVTANTDHTVVGNMAVAAATSGRFLTRKTAANTFITYRIS